MRGAGKTREIPPARAGLAGREAAAGGSFFIAGFRPCLVATLPSFSMISAPSFLRAGSRARHLLFGLSLAFALAARAQTPSSYDLNSGSLLTAVKNQGRIGTCWAFANTTAFQSAILKAGLATGPADPSIRISTWHLATANGNQTDLTAVYDPKTGKWNYDGWGSVGLNEFATGYWTRGRGQWSGDWLRTLGDKGDKLDAGGGPVLVSSNPKNSYPIDAVANHEYLLPYVPPASQEQAPFQLVQSVSIDWDKDAADLAAYQEKVKQAILKYGAVVTGVHADNPQNDRAYPVFYGDAKYSDHAVALVGWDDTKVLDYHGQEFIGGWLIQNSWGEFRDGRQMGDRDAITGEAGYYWVPFADVSPANVKQTTALVVRSDTYEPTGQKYAPTVIQKQIFAPLNAQGVDAVQRGFATGTDTQAAARQTIPDNSAVASIGLWQAYAGSTVDIRLYSGWGAKGPTGTLLGEKLHFTMNADGPGYNLIDLDTPIRFGEGGDIFVVVDFGDANDRPATIDFRTLAELDTSASFYGLSWISSNGTDWTDLVHDSTKNSGVFFMKLLRLQEDLDNAAGIDARYGYTVDGEVGTAPSGQANAIAYLNFEDGGVLTTRGALTVTTGVFNVPDYYATGILTGTGAVKTPGSFLKMGEGALQVFAPVQVGGDATVSGGALLIGNRFSVGGDFVQFGAEDVSTTIATRARLQVGGALTVGAGSMEVQGTLSAKALNVAGLLNVTGLATAGALDINAGGIVETGVGSEGGVQGNPAPVTIRPSGVAVGPSGSVIVNGLLKGSLASAGFLGGSGIVQGNVTSSGTVAPGNSPGTLTIGGNFTQTSAGTLEIQIASQAVFDRLVVGGTATLGGTLDVMPDGGTLALGQRYEFLQAGAVEGTFDTVLVPGFRGRLLESAGDLTLLIAPASYTQLAVTQNERHAAAALDSFIPATSGDRMAVSLALDELPPADYPAAFDAVSPYYYESLLDISLNQSQTQNQLLSQRLSMVRMGARGFAAPDMASPIHSDAKDNKSVLDAKQDILRPAEDNPWGVWVLGNGLFTQIPSIQDLSGYNANGGGVLAGLDYSLGQAEGPQLTFGAYTGYQGMYAEYDGGGKTSVNSALFGTCLAAEYRGFYFNSIVAGAYNGYDTRRPISFGGIDRTAASQPNGGTLATYLETGYDFKVAGFSFGPLVSAQYTYGGIAPFTETGADALDLRVNQQNLNK